eukprot:TRINITY_DN4123_c0_g3_i1.p1 TRINITY_DN4123_c0_g3~~TRINITY_DN4123_c0_g3_i1.p1  ORF type:complete len:109 (+),score=5.26 TRINITY_DN4123_c0_g3_i1:171-497(+)
MSNNNSSPRKAVATYRAYHKSMSSIKWNKIMSPKCKPVITIYITNKLDKRITVDDSENLLHTNTQLMTLSSEENKTDTTLSNSIACRGRRIKKDALKYNAANRLLKNR